MNRVIVRLLSMALTQIVSNGFAFLWGKYIYGVHRSGPQWDVGTVAFHVGREDFVGDLADQFEF